LANSDLAEFIDEYHAALDAFFRGDPEPAKKLYSHREDASLANPFGPVAIGWQQVEATMERAAANYRDGAATSFDTLATYVTQELAYLVEVERFEAKVGGQEDMASGALRATSVIRPEDGGWKIVHRHADPITAPRAAESVISPRSVPRPGGLPRVTVRSLNVVERTAR
jgi:ketosteroid isomerase-like protein